MTPICMNMGIAKVLNCLNFIKVVVSVADMWGPFLVVYSSNIKPKYFVVYRSNIKPKYFDSLSGASGL
jgi:hypothetical protein